MAETVLIADGKGARRRRLKSLLSALGYHVLTAGRGAAALALAETVRLRVVLMAARLPEMPAETLLQAIRKRNRDATQLILCAGPASVRHCGAACGSSPRALSVASRNGSSSGWRPSPFT
jgi:CheY-like chemotaxis protein